MPVTILPNGYNLFAKIVEGLPPHEQCPICDMWFLEMSERADIEAHIARCTERQADEERMMVRLGYKRTSKGWVRT